MLESWRLSTGKHCDTCSNRQSNHDVVPWILEPSPRNNVCAHCVVYCQENREVCALPTTDPADAAAEDATTAPPGSIILTGAGIVSICVVAVFILATMMVRSVVMSGWFQTLNEYGEYEAVTFKTLAKALFGFERRDSRILPNAEVSGIPSLCGKVETVRDSVCVSEYCNPSLTKILSAEETCHDTFQKPISIPHPHAFLVCLLVGA